MESAARPTVIGEAPSGTTVPASSPSTTASLRGVEELRAAARCLGCGGTAGALEVGRPGTGRLAGCGRASLRGREVAAQHQDDREHRHHSAARKPNRIRVIANSDTAHRAR